MIKNILDTTKQMLSGLALYAVMASIVVATISSYQALPVENIASAQSHAQQSAIIPTFQDELAITADEPHSLHINDLDMNENIIDGSYNAATGEWDISELHAHFADISVIPNDKQGNTFIYGHKNKAVFESLVHLNPGDEAVIVSKKGYNFKYVYVKSEQLKPTDTTIFNYTGVPSLTLQTCSGSWNQHRTLYHFDFVSVERV